MDDRHPDPSRGVFETLLVVEGEAVELVAHLERLARSVEALYSQALPPRAEEELRETALLKAASDLPLGRLRITVAPGEDVLRLDPTCKQVESENVFPTRGVKLRSHHLPGGLGPHKWADREGIDRPAPGEPGALIVDGGEALEAGWANLFAVRDGALFTPPLDGRLLPGTTRAAVLELAAQEGIETDERPLSPGDLLSAAETFLTNSIRGIEPAVALDGDPLPGRGTLSRRLAAALRRRWNLPDDCAAPATPAAGPTTAQPAR